MKKNITINLCGRLYQIDEDAFALLSNYTDSLRNYFSKQEGCGEIADDIEQRIAELFDELKAQGIEAITIEHVEAIIHQIGNVEDITGEAENDNENENENHNKNDNENENENASGNAQKTNSQRKTFFRDGNDKVFCGVLSGCAHYFGGTANSWRWIYAAICVVWMIVCGFNPFSFAFFTSGLLSFAGFIMAIFFAPVMLAPAVPYFLAAIFAKEAVNPEDQLKMKGKEVTPQSIAMEVTEQTAKEERKKDPNNVTVWNAISGVFSVGLSILLGIFFLIPLGFLVALIVNTQGFVSSMLGLAFVQNYVYVSLPFALLFLSIMACIGILLYCSIHSAVSSFKKCKTMSVTQRIVWLVVWIFSVINIVGAAIFLDKRREEVFDTERQRQEEEQATWDRQHTHDGIIMSDEDWDVIREGGWTITKSQNTDRYTYSGEYMDGDEYVRYLDACNWSEPVIVTIEKTEKVEPGIYTLAAACRADNTGRYIFAQVEGNDTLYVSEIPVSENEGGNIWAAASNAKKELVKSSTKVTVLNVDVYENEETEDVSENLGPDSLLVRQYLRNFISPSKYASIKNANNGEGYGWNVVFVKDIVITAPSTITYGISTDPDFTGGVATEGYFSATDFHLFKK